MMLKKGPNICWFEVTEHENITVCPLGNTADPGERLIVV